MLSFPAAALALSVATPGWEAVETRVNLFGGNAVDGQSVLLEHDWIHRKAPLAAEEPAGYRPSLGLYAAWIHGQFPGDRGEADLLVLGATTKFLSLPTHTGADAYFAARMGLGYRFTGDEAVRGFGEDPLDWLDFCLSVGFDLGRFHRLQPVVEVHLSPSNLLFGGRFGISLPLSQKQPLPPAPPAGAYVGPLLHGSVGAVFTADHAGLPIGGEKWFGGLVEAGISLYRTPRRQIILGTRALAAGADPGDAWSGTRPGLRAAALTLAWQDFGSPALGLGYRVTAGGHYFTRYRDGWGVQRDLMPVFGIMILAPTRSGFYPFLEIGTLGPNPVVLGVGRSF